MKALNLGVGAKKNLKIRGGGGGRENRKKNI